MWPNAEQPSEEYSGLSIGAAADELPADTYSNLNPEGPTFTPQGGCPPNPMPTSTSLSQAPYSAGQYGAESYTNLPGPPQALADSLGYVPAEGASSGAGWYGDGMGMQEDYNEEAMEGIANVPQPVPEGPCVMVPALSFRQPLAGLILYGVKQIEARSRPMLRQLQGAA